MRSAIGGFGGVAIGAEELVDVLRPEVLAGRWEEAALSQLAVGGAVVLDVLPFQPSVLLGGFADEPKLLGRVERFTEAVGEVAAGADARHPMLAEEIEELTAVVGGAPGPTDVPSLEEVVPVRFSEDVADGEAPQAPAVVAQGSFGAPRSLVDHDRDRTRGSCLRVVPRLCARATRTRLGKLAA